MVEETGNTIGLKHEDFGAKMDIYIYTHTYIL